MRISDWSSDVCSSDLRGAIGASFRPGTRVGRLIPNASSGLEEWSHIPLRREDKTRLTGPLTPLRPILACASRSAAYVGNDVHCATIDRLGLSPLSSEERRVGKGCVRTCRSRWSPDH